MYFLKTFGENYINGEYKFISPVVKPLADGGRVINPGWLQSNKSGKKFKKKKGGKKL